MEEGVGSVWFLWGPRSKSLPQVDASGITIPLQPNFKLGLARVPPSPVHNHTFFREFSGVYKNYFISWKLSYALCSCFNLYSGSTKPLSSCDLKAVTNDDSTGNRTVTFTVVSSPRLEVAENELWQQHRGCFHFYPISGESWHLCRWTELSVYVGCHLSSSC
jgi:hypothetical protein